MELRKRWLVTIRREQYTISSHTKVCSRHFTDDQLIPPKTLGGRRRLQKGAVPVLFNWNDYSLPPRRSSVWDRVDRPVPADNTDDDPEPMNEDAEGCDPETTALAMAQNENKNLKEEVEMLKRLIEDLKFQSTFGLRRFAASDEDIRLDRYFIYPEGNSGIQ